MPRQSISDMPVSRVYPLLVQKAERKGRTKQEVDAVIKWLTGYDMDEVDQSMTYGEFFQNAPEMNPRAEGARNYSQCDSLLIGSRCGAHTFPVIRSLNPTAIVEHEATTSKISEDQLFYCTQRGIPPEDAVGLIVGGYAREVLARLPMEFAMEAGKLLQVSLEGSIG